MNNYDNNWYPNPEREKIRTRNFFRRNLWAITSTGVAAVAIVALILVLTHPAAPINSTTQSSSKTTSTTAPSGTTSHITGNTVPTQAPNIAAGTVLCQYNATKGFSGWINSPQWKQINDGTLGSDGTDNGQGANTYFAWSGCQLPTANYAVEAQVQIVRYNGDTSEGTSSEFGIIVRGNGNESGYEAGVGEYTPFGGSSSFCGNAEQLAMIALVQSDNTGKDNCGNQTLNPLSGASQSYQVDTNWHTYRAEITGNTIRLFIDGNKILETSDNTFTDAGKVGLRDINDDINVKSFTVTAL